MSAIADVLDKLRRPASTGANRCLPCTALNLGVLAAGVAALAYRKRRFTALALAASGASAIWFRGYFVPYTPRFAPRLVAALGVEEFFHARDERDAYETPGGPGSIGDSYDPQDALGRSPDDGERDTEPDGDAVLTMLLESGIVRPDGEDLSLAPEVREDWRAEIDSLNSLASPALGAELEASLPTITETRVIDDERAEREGRWIAFGDGGGIASESWLSRPIAIGELAAIRALEAFDLPLETRLAAARPLRMFLSTCPDCGGRVEASTTATCCGGLASPRQGPQDVLACTGCNERLFTFPRVD
ncbi:hypothetical protein BRC86_02480 [Halobacteriales archaeon QS_3_64_16]|nr:MAG: hypothetical protein BRC86_02480 [Halobacteriales archaeon QS_3_64_16]